MNTESRTTRHAAKGSRPIGSTSPARTAVYRARLAAMSDADRWMSETPREWWSETLATGAIGVDAHLLTQLGATDADAEEAATAYAEAFRAAVSEALTTPRIEWPSDEEIATLIKRKLTSLQLEVIG